MTTRAGRVFKTLAEKIKRVQNINKDLLGACKVAIAYLEDGAPNTAHDRLEQAIARAEGRDEK